MLASLPRRSTGARNSLVGVGTLCALGFASAVHAQAGTDLLSDASEQSIKSIVVNAVEQGSAGARAYLRGKTVVELTNEDALTQARERSLQIQGQQRSRAITEGFFIESKAAFDALVNLALTYTITDTFERSEVITRERGVNITSSGRPLDPNNPEVPGDTQFENDAPGGEESDESGIVDPIRGGNVEDDSAAFGSFVCVTVDGRLINPEECSLQTQVTTEQEFASRNSDAEDAWQAVWGASKFFHWGQTLSLEFETMRRDKNFFPIDNLGLNRQLSPDDPIGRGSKFPWTSSFTASFDTPLPYSKDFGNFGSAPNVGLLLARVDNERAAQDLSAVANNALRDTDAAYWELVRSLKQLQIVIQQRELLEQQVSRAGNLFRAGRITTYDKAQVDANLEVTRNLEEIAWNNLAVNSNVLADLLDYEHDQMILPSAYSELLGEPFEFDVAEAFETARSRNPQFKASELALESSDILLEHRKQQTRPDLRLTVSLGLSQTDRVLGYESLGDSISNVFDPDQNDFFIGIGYVYPFGNKALKSVLTQARLGREQAQAQLQLTENAIMQDINSITATAFSAQSRIKQTKAGVQLSQLAYDKARDQAGSQGITEFELLSRLNSLLSARSSYIDVLVDYRQSQAQLLAAQGVLAERF